MTRLLTRPVVLLTVLAGVGLVVACGGRPWVSQALAGVPGVTRVTVSGNTAAPAVTAVALVAAAGAVALALTGRVARRIIAGLLVLAGLGVLALTVSVLQDPAGAVLPAVQNATGRVGSPPSGPAPQLTPWAWPAAAGGVLILAGGVAALLGSGRWGRTGRRFEAASGTAASVSSPAGEDGDPTVGGDARAGAQASSGRAPGPRARRDQDLDTWDALSRGEDPTAG